MERFVQHKIDILVSTTVIEVGVDVPNASIMLVESVNTVWAGTVTPAARSSWARYRSSYLLSFIECSKPVSRRLRALESSNDGFRLAELDLELGDRVQFTELPSTVR